MGHPPHVFEASHENIETGLVALLSNELGTVQGCNPCPTQAHEKTKERPFQTTIIYSAGEMTIIGAFEGAPLSMCTLEIIFYAKKVLKTQSNILL